MTGKGKMISSDQSIYEGEFLNDVPHGVGILKHDSKYVIKGVWNQGKYQLPNSSLI